ncbi:MAG: hypothetical protein ACRDQT_04910 [Gaiellaceae bacterium]
MTPRGMRRFAVFVVFFSAYMAVLGIANLATGFIGGNTFTIVAVASAILGLGGAVEVWYVSRRIERVRFANRNAKPS